MKRLGEEVLREVGGSKGREEKKNEKDDKRKKERKRRLIRKWRSWRTNRRWWGCEGRGDGGGQGGVGEERDYSTSNMSGSLNGFWITYL